MIKDKKNVGFWKWRLKKMSKSAIGYIFSFIILVLLQVSVFNRIALFGYATPFLFLYFILKLPTTLSANWTMTLSFLMGLVIDIFSNTPGMYALDLFPLLL